MFKKKPNVIINLSPSMENGCSRVAKSNNALADELARQNAARNRVDISLEEYESLKKKINELELEAFEMRRILKEIEFPVEHIDKIIPGSIEIIWAEGPPEFAKPRRHRCTIQFDVEKW